MKAAAAVQASWLDRLSQRWLAFSLRERALLLATVLAALFFLCNDVLLAMLADDNARLDRQIKRLDGEVEALRQEQREVLAAFTGDPDERLRGEIDKGRLRLQALSGDLANVSQRLVPPEQMPELLDHVLDRHPGVRLVRVQNLAPDQLATEGMPAGVVFFRHGLRIELEGGYADVVAWLSSMERLPWEFVWESLRYDVTEYPDARVQVEVQTVSTQEGWIGIGGEPS